MPVVVQAAFAVKVLPRVALVVCEPTWGLLGVLWLCLPKTAVLPLPQGLVAGVADAPGGVEVVCLDGVGLPVVDDGNRDGACGGG